jgi:hypothetical protein
MADNTTHSNNGLYIFNPLGGNSLQPFIESAGSTGSNKDVLSRFTPYLGNVTGALNDSRKPILYTYLEITTASSGTGGTSEADYYLQLATGASGSGGSNDTVKQTTYGTKSFNPNVASFAYVSSTDPGQTVYYGFYIVPGTGTLNFYRGDNSDNTRNPNGIYIDGTSYASWDTTAIYGEIRYASVPAAPGQPSGEPGSNYVNLSFTEPADNGGSSITSYRVLVSTDQATWYSTDKITSYTNTSGTIELTVSGYYATSSATTLTPLSPATDYYFQVSAINAVSEAHSTNFKDTAAHAGSPSAVSDIISTLGYGKRFTSTTATTDIRYASRYTGNSGDSVVVEGVTYTGWTKIANVKRGSAGGWTNLTG